MAQAAVAYFFLLGTPIYEYILAGQCKELASFIDPSRIKTKNLSKLKNISFECR